VRSFLILFALVAGMYFAFFGRDLLSGPRGALADRRHFQAADQAFERGWNLVRRDSFGAPRIAPADIPAACARFDEAASSAEAVSEKFLKSVHAGLPAVYRQNYLGGLRQLSASLRAKDQAGVVAACQKLRGFANWAGQHTSIRIRTIE
jgi:hypothetical protein